MPINSAWILGGSLIALSAAYFFYGRFVAGILGIDPKRKTPAHEKYDGIDYVPAKNWAVLFGHHFSSICGAGPIVGPALACAYWGWGPSLAWLIIGAIWMGAVSDFSSLFVSIRSDGNSISEITREAITPRARTFFAVFIWISIILVIAVFAIFAAKTFIEEADAVVPSVGLIPLALVVGWLLYKTRVNNTLVTVASLLILIALLWGGVQFPLTLVPMGPVSTENVWIVLLLIYCFFASVLPVQWLLQPRDYLASFVLFASIGIGVAGVFTSGAVMQSDPFLGFAPAEWKTAGPLWPMLFVTIACGAISGFHTLVSSGTTCKQISTETHACRIGYGGMLVECLVGVLVVISVGAGLSYSDLGSSIKAAGPIAAYSRGYGNITAGFLGDYGRPFAVLALNAFILTTLDSATRIARYLTSELFGIKNSYVSTTLVVIAAAALAFTGQWNRLWPAFGAANQLIAALSLLVVSCWLLHRGKTIWFTLIPAGLMLVTTIAAFLFQAYNAVTAAKPDYGIASVAGILIMVSLVVFAEAAGLIRKKLHA